MTTDGFFNSHPIERDRKYSAESLNALMDGIITRGVLHSQGGQFMASASSGMDISVASGKAWFNRSWLISDQASIFTIGTAHPTNDRTDILVFDFSKLPEHRTNTVKVLQNTTLANLIDEPFRKQIPIASIQVIAGATSIGQQNITNHVGTSLCPFSVTPLSQVSIDILLAQWSAEFQLWFDNLVTILDQDAQTTILNIIQQLEDVVNENMQNTLDSLGRRNVLINGDMRVQNRNPIPGFNMSGQVTTYGQVDRWEIDLNTSAAYNAFGWINDPTIDDAPGKSLRISFDVASGQPNPNEYFRLVQHIPNHMLKDLNLGFSNPKPLKLSFVTETNHPGTFVAELINTGPHRSVFQKFTCTAGVNSHELSFPADVLASALPHDVWEQDYDSQIKLVFWFVAGFDITNGSGNDGVWGTYPWIPGANPNRGFGTVTSLGENSAGYLSLTNVQLEIGDIHTPYETLPLQQQVDECEFYYESVDGPHDGHGVLSQMVGGTSSYGWWVVDMRNPKNPAVGGTVDLHHVNIIYGSRNGEYTNDSVADAPAQGQIETKFSIRTSIPGLPEDSVSVGSVRYSIDSDFTSNNGPNS